MADTVVTPDPAVRETAHPNAPSSNSIRSALSIPPTEAFEVEDAPATAAEDETVYPQGFKMFALVSAVLIILVSGGFDVTVVAVTVPSLSNEFRALGDIGWYSTSTRLALCAFMFVWGKAYTVFDVRMLFTTSILIRMVGQVIATFAQTSSMFIIGRFIDGMGGGGLLNGCFVIFTQAMAPRKRPFWMGVAGLVETLSSLSAPVIGGALIDKWTWRACYGLNIPVSLAAATVAWFTLQLPENPDTRLPLTEKLRRLDLLGTAAFVPATVSLLLALQWGGLEYNWGNARIVVLFVLSGILYSIFAYVQHWKGEHASIPPRILKLRSLYAGAVFNFCFNAAIATVEYYMSIYFQGVKGYSAGRAGLLALPMIAGLSVACLAMGTGVSLLGYYYPFMWLGATMATVSTGILTTTDIDTHLTKILVCQAFLGVAVGLGVLGPQMAAQAILDPKEVSIGISIIQFGQQMGPVVLLAGSAALFTNRLTTELTTRVPSLNATDVDSLGLSDIRRQFEGEKLKQILWGYDDAVIKTLYLPLAVSCVAFLAGLAMERRSVKEKKN